MNGQYFETELKIKDRNSFEPQTGYFELSSSQRLTTFVLPMIICFSAIMARFSSNIVQDFDFSIGQNLSSGYIALKSPHFLNFRSFMLSVLHMRSISSWMDSSLNDRNVGDFSARVNMLSSTSCFPGKLRTLTASWSSSQRPRSGIWGQARLSTLRLSHAKTVPPCLQNRDSNSSCSDNIQPLACRGRWRRWPATTPGTWPAPGSGASQSGQTRSRAYSRWNAGSGWNI